MNDTISVLDIIEETVVDGPGFRTAVYAAGCPNQCAGCHNPQSWDIEAGRQMSVADILDKIKSDEFAQVTFSGGDPIFQVEAFTTLARRIKEETGKNIWCYTGWKYEDIKQSERLSQILPYLDVLVDGRYEQNLRDEQLPFRGSSNQRLIDVQASLSAGSTVLYSYETALESANPDCDNNFRR
ncbi:MAG: anaerobic ribonucleoside-triphosphate reductase activating protein [Bacteroidaceae bacterium]|nr:anaerobic ribonucleoside-triphosphate reductase activating protein [Bacteroidaceae bacterium]